MRKSVILRATVVLALFFSFYLSLTFLEPDRASGQGFPPVRVEELDGDPAIPAIYKLIVPNGSLTKSGGVGTLTISPGVGGTGSTDFFPIFTSSSAIGNSNLLAESTHVYAMRNSTNAQLFYIYNTFTNASNYERVRMGWDGSNNFFLSSQSAGTGSPRSVAIGTEGANNVVFRTAATSRWFVSGTNGNFLANADATYDIGASGANRPNNIYSAAAMTAGTALVATTTITAGSDIRMLSGSGVVFQRGGDGILSLTNSGGTGFDRLNFGGGTSTKPALKVNNTGLEFRKGDDSGRTYTQFAGYSMGVVAKTGNYTATQSDTLITVDATGGAVTITVPVATTSSGMVLIIKKTDASANAVTVQRSSSDTIDGATSVSLANQYDSVTIVSNGTASWFIVAATP